MSLREIRSEFPVIEKIMSLGKRNSNIENIENDVESLACSETQNGGPPALRVYSSYTGTKIPQLQLLDQEQTI